MFRFENKTVARNRNLALLALRLTAGSLMAGHGAQKLFGVSDGPGLEGTAGMMGSMGLKPSKPWALLAGGSEFGSGLLTALGLLGPLGPISMIAPMTIAAATVHAGKPIWVTKGGAELPLINITIATTLTLTGPGRYSLDELLGIRIPQPLVALSATAVAAGVGVALWMHQKNSTSQSDAPSKPQQVATPTTDQASEPDQTVTDAIDQPSELPLQARELGA